MIAHTFGEHLLTRMAKGRMPEIVRQRDRFGEILIQR